MILLDYSAVSITNMFGFISREKNASESDLKYVILNSLRKYNVKFRDNYGEMVVCVDSRMNWRKDFFEEYKSSRKKDRKKSKIDWDVIFKVMDDTLNDVLNNFPFRVIRVDKMEGDDIIGVLALYSSEKTVVVSKDKDFVQLISEFVHFYHIGKNEMISINKEEQYKTCLEHLIRGDKDDGVPNIFSDDDTFIDPKKRQPSIFKKDVKKWVLLTEKELLNMFEKPIKRNYMRNKMMIDLTMIPEEYVEQIKKEFEKSKNSDTIGGIQLIKYFMNNKMKMFMKLSSDFLMNSNNNQTAITKLMRI